MRAMITSYWIGIGLMSVAFLTENNPSGAIAMLGMGFVIQAIAILIAKS